MSETNEPFSFDGIHSLLLCSAYAAYSLHTIQFAGILNCYTMPKRKTRMKDKVFPNKKCFPNFQDILYNLPMLCIWMEQLSEPGKVIRRHMFLASHNYIFPGTFSVLVLWLLCSLCLNKQKKSWRKWYSHFWCTEYVILLCGCGTGFYLPTIIIINAYQRRCAGYFVCFRHNTQRTDFRMLTLATKSFELKWQQGCRSTYTHNIAFICPYQNGSCGISMKLNVCWTFGSCFAEQFCDVTRACFMLINATAAVHHHTYIVAAVCDRSYNTYANCQWYNQLLDGDGGVNTRSSGKNCSK